MYYTIDERVDYNSNYQKNSDNNEKTVTGITFLSQLLMNETRLTTYA